LEKINMVYFLGRDVSVKIKAGDHIGVEANATFTYAGGAATEFASTTGVSVSDLTGVDLGIGVTDEDVTYIGSKTVLKAEIKKETTVSLTRKKSNNAWDAIFNGEARWGVPASASAPIANMAGEPDVSTGVTFGYQVEITLLTGTEVFKVPNAQITGHTVSLNADGTTEETIEFVSQENPVIAAT
jgi:hypothetical protein